MQIRRYISSHIGLQIFLSFIFVLAFSIGSFLIAFFSIDQAKQTEPRLSATMVPVIREVSRLNVEMLEYVILFETVLNSNDAIEHNLIQERQTSIRGKLARISSEFDELGLDIEGLEQRASHLIILSNGLVEKVSFERVALLAELNRSKLVLTDQYEDSEILIRRQSISNVDFGASNSSVTPAEFLNYLGALKSITIQIDSQINAEALNGLKQSYTGVLRDFTLKVASLPASDFKQTLSLKLTELFSQVDDDDRVFSIGYSLNSLDQEISKSIDNYKEQQNIVNDEILKLLTLAQAKFQGDINLLSENVDRNFLVLTAGLVLSVLGAFIPMVFFVYPRFIKRVRSLSRATAEIAEGNYDFSIEVDGNDELSELAKALKHLKKNEVAARDAQNFRDLIMESIPDYVFTKDSDYTIVQANHRFLDLYPSDLRDNVVGTTTIGSYDKEVASELLKHDTIALTEGYSEIEEEIQFPDGKTRTLFTKKVRFYDSENKPYILSVARDITALKTTEKALRKSNAELDDFAFIASHDLKEPIRGVYNYAHFLMEDYGGLLDSDGRHKLDRLVLLSKYMETLISDLLYYSRLGRIESKQIPVDLNDVIEETKEFLFNNGADRLRIKETLPKVLGVRTQLLELFRNIISNGLKYNDSTVKEITIDIEKNSPRALKDHVTITVSDNGIGIDPRFHDEIFKIFRRLHKKDAYGGGTGSGLTLVKKIADKHQGVIALDSELGSGTVFYISLPESIVCGKEKD